jgi:hypothetical protein
LIPHPIAATGGIGSREKGLVWWEMAKSATGQVKGSKKGEIKKKQKIGKRGKIFNIQISLTQVPWLSSDGVPTVLAAEWDTSTAMFDGEKARVV